MTKNTKLSLEIFTAFSLFGYIASVLTVGMKGDGGPQCAAVFLLSVSALDFILIKRGAGLKRTWTVNLYAILPFYFFSITLPLIRTCPSWASPVVAFAGFSAITYLPFMLMAFLIRKILDRI